MRADHQVTLPEDMGRNRVDSNRLRLAAAVFERPFEAPQLDRRPQLDWIESYVRSDAHEIVDHLELSSALPVGLEERSMHVFELALLACELGRPQRLARVDDHVALPPHEAHLLGDGVEAASHLL